MRKIYVLLLMGLMLLSLTACTGNTEYKPGTYTGSAQSKDGPVKVEVTFSKDKIEDVKIISNEDDPEYATKAVEGMPGIIISAQSLGVDAVSGATLTSRGIIAAVAQCVQDAGVAPEKLGYASVEEKTKGQEILITGLSEEKTITGEEIKGMTLVEFDAISIDASGDQTPTTGKGVKLEDILAKYGESQKNYDAISLNATDGYAIEIPKEVLGIRDVIIAYEINGEACDLRSVVPEERAMYWVKFLNKIELKGSVTAVETENLILLETAALQCEAEDYKYYDSVDKAIPIGQLLEKTVSEKSDAVGVSGLDGWARNETYDLYKNQYIKTTGESAPMFIGPDLPEGMRMKEMLYNKVGKDLILSIAMAQGKLGSISIGDKTGVSLDKIIQEFKVKEAGTYVLKGTDGYEVQLSSEDLKKGILYVTEEGANCVFEGLGNNTSITGLLSIKPVQ